MYEILDGLGVRWVLKIAQGNVNDLIRSKPLIKIH